MVKTAAIILSSLCAGMAIGSGIESRLAYAVISNMDPNSTATLIAGFGGAALGGIVSLILAVIGNHWTKLREDASRIEVEQAQALDLIATLVQLSGRCYTLTKASKGAVAKDAVDPWKYLKAAPKSSTGTPRFRSEAFVPFMKAGRSDIISDCLLLADRADSLQASMDAYSDMRLDMQLLAEQFTVVRKDGLAETIFTGQAVNIAAFRAHTMNDAIEQIATMGDQWVAESRTLIEVVSKTHKAYFGEHSKMEIVPDPTAE